MQVRFPGAESIVENVIRVVCFLYENIFNVVLKSRECIVVEVFLSRDLAYCSVVFFLRG